MNARRDEDFTGYVQARLAWLRRVAYLLCQDWQQADDLVQTAITSLYVHWLTWEYAGHAWATLYVSRRGTAIPAATIVKVAAHVRFAATAKPVVKFPFQLTGLPTSWRVISVAWRATVDGLLVSTSRELGSSTTVGRADGPVTGTIGYIAITPGKSKCPFFRGSSEGSSKRSPRAE